MLVVAACRCLPTPAVAKFLLSKTVPGLMAGFFLNAGELSKKMAYRCHQGSLHTIEYLLPETLFAAGGNRI